MRKARDTAKSASFIKRFDQRTNILLKPKTLVVWPGDKDATGLVDKNTLLITDQVDGLGAAIGTARFNDIEFVSGSGADNAIYRYTISEIKFTASGKTMKDAKSFVNAATGFVGHTVPGADGIPEISAANNSAMVFQIERNNIKSLRDADNSLNGSLSINVRRKLKATLDSSGTATFNTLTNEFFEAINNTTICFVTSTANVTETKKLDGTNSSVAPTAFTVNFGAAYAGQTVTVIATMLKTNQREKTKTLNTSTVTTSTWPGNVAGTTVYLGKADAFDVVKVELYDHTDNANPILVSDVTKNFRLQNGQTDFAYGESSIVMTTPISTGVNGSSRLHVTFRYFEHSGTEGFFTVDSYSQVINDPANDLTYADIPVFVASNGAKIPLINAFDFRPVMLIDGTMNGSVPANNSTAIFDVEFYLPRTDLILINKADGDLRDTAMRTVADYAGALRLLRRRPQDPPGFPKALPVSAIAVQGLDTAWDDMVHLNDWRQAQGHFRARRAEQARQWFLAELRAGLLARLDQPEMRARLRETGDSVARGDEDPAAAAARMLDWLGVGSEPPPR